MGGAQSQAFDYDADLLGQKKARASWPKGEEKSDGSATDNASASFRAKGFYKKNDDGIYEKTELTSSFKLTEEETKDFVDSDIPVPSDITTMSELLDYGAVKYKDNPLYGTRKYNEDGSRGDYVWISFAEFREKSRNLARGLEEICGIQKDGNVGIFAMNRVEWCITSWGNMTRSFRTVALYDTLGPDAIEHILGHAELTVVSCEKKQIAKLLEVKKKNGDKLPLKYIVQFDPDETIGNDVDKVEDDDKKACEDLGMELLAFSDVMTAGKKQEDALPDSAPTKDDLAFIMYTSGTTGVPKGAMLTHENIVATSAAATPLFGLCAKDRHLSYLTLAHIYETTVHLGYVYAGGQIAFFGGDIRKLIDDFPVANPTVFCGVPRVYQRIYDRVLSQVSEASLVKRFFFHRYLAKSSVAIRKGERVESADKKVWEPLRARLGLKDVRTCVTGAAPMPAYLSEFLKIALGCCVQQGYGLTETAAACAISEVDDFTVGHVGPPLSCVETKLVAVPEMEYLPTDKPCPRGEVWIRGPNVFKGYYKQEDKTKEVFPDDDGFFASGDVGRINPNGTLSIIDRKKNIFKLSQGEYIASERIEGLYSKAESVGQVWVYGNSYKPFVVAVVVPNFAWIIKLAKSKTFWPTNDSELKVGTEEYNEKFAKLFTDSASKDILKDAVVQDLRSKEEALKGFEKVRDILIETSLDDLGQGFTVDNDCLTPSFKLRRPQLKTRYKDELMALYKKNGEDGEEGF